MLTKNGSHLGYQTHYVVDGGKSRIILGVLVAASEVSENKPMLDLLWRARFRWKLWPRQATADRKYGTEDNPVALESQYLRAYIPSPDNDHRTAFFSSQEFQYHAERDVYVCPAGKELHYFAPHSTERSRRYRARAKDGNHCPRHPPNVPLASRGGACAAAWRKTRWIECVPMLQLSPTRKPYASAVSGSSRYLRDQQTVAWHETLSLAAPLARELRGPDASGWTKSQTAAQKARMGTAPLPSRSRFCSFFGCVWVDDS